MNTLGGFRSCFDALTHTSHPWARTVILEMKDGAYELMQEGGDEFHSWLMSWGIFSFSK